MYLCQNFVNKNQIFSTLYRKTDKSELYQRYFKIFKM